MPSEPDWLGEYPGAKMYGSYWPCPAGWVINEPEGLANRWVRYPGIGEGQGTDYDVLQALDEDYDAYNDHRAEDAFLIGDDVAGSIREESIRWELSIANETVFRRVEPEWGDLLAACAEALARYANDHPHWDDVTPETGELPDAEQREREIERRQEQNQSLTDWSDSE